MADVIVKDAIKSYSVYFLNQLTLATNDETLEVITLTTVMISILSVLISALLTISSDLSMDFLSHSLRFIINMIIETSNELKKQLVEVIGHSSSSMKMVLIAQKTRDFVIARMSSYDKSLTTKL